MLPTTFQFIWPSGFRGEDFKKSANQKQEFPMAAMFVNGFIRDHNKVRFVLVAHVVNIKSKKKIAIGNGFLYPELKCF